MEVITPNNGRQPWAIQGSQLTRPEQMSHCPTLAWGGCGGRGFPRTARRYIRHLQFQSEGGPLWTKRADVTMRENSCGKLLGDAVFFVLCTKHAVDGVRRAAAGFVVVAN